MYYVKCKFVYMLQERLKVLANLKYILGRSRLLYRNSQTSKVSKVYEN